MASPPNTLPDLYIHYINNVYSIQFPYILNEENLCLIWVFLNIIISHSSLTFSTRNQNFITIIIIFISSLFTLFTQSISFFPLFIFFVSLLSSWSHSLSTSSIFFCLSNILGLSLSFPRSLHSLLFLYLIIFHSLSFFLSSLYPFFLFSSQSNSF